MLYISLLITLSDGEDQVANLTLSDDRLDSM